LHIDGIRSVALFEGTVREAIHRLKYDYVRDLAVPLGEMLFRFWEQTPLGSDVIVPVPLHARRLKERGYNQATLLARQLGQATGIPVDDQVLRRNRYTSSQTGLTAQQRRRNVQAAFSCKGAGMAGKRVVLIDDVCTTGATLEACSEAMRDAHAQSVWALTVARAA
jgi:ComF family protein